MPSSTFSSEPPIRWRSEFGRLARHLVVVGIVFLLVGEVWFRVPWTTKMIVWDFDEERGGRLAAPQSRGMGLGNFSVVSPNITINRDGYRNAEIDWQSPTILAVGSSEMLAPGVKDDEVWTSIASKQLSETVGRTVTVVNAGSSSYGPFQQSVTVRRFLERHPRPQVVLVRASIGDRVFYKPTAAELEASKRQNEFSRRVKQYSEFLPYLVNKLQAQVVAIRQTFRPDRASEQRTPAHEAPDVADAMWKRNVDYWRDIAACAAAAQVAVVFFVDGADGAASAYRLKALLDGEFGGRHGVAIVIFTPREIGLDVSSDRARRADYVERFTLGYDPHSNATLHRLLAQFLTPILLEQLARDAG